MSEQRILDLYRLALSLIPDASAAGDIFMEARDAADLNRLARRWRKAHDLPPLEEPPPLPELDAFQEETAYHLAARAQLKRRWRAVAAVALSAICGVVLLMAARPVWEARSLSPAFRAAPAGSARSPEGLQTLVYRAEVLPGSVTVYWEISGPGAMEAASAMDPYLRLDGRRFWIPPVWTEPEIARPNRFAARSSYEIQVTSARQAAILFMPAEGSSIRGAGPIWVPLENLTARTASTIHLEQNHRAGGASVQIHSVTLEPDRTSVRYTTTAPAEYRPATIQRMQAEELLLNRREHATQVTAAGDLLVEAVFDPVPSGLATLTAYFTPPARELREVVYQLPASEHLSPITRMPDRSYFLFTPPLHHRLLLSEGETPYFTDQDGRRYPALYLPPQYRNGELQYSLVILDPPPDAVFATLTLPRVEEVVEMAPLELDLVPHQGAVAQTNGSTKGRNP